MKITALEIKQHEFEKSFRGYDIEEVNNFLSNISQEWERLLNESKMLKMQLEIAEKEASKLKEVEMTLIKTLRTAEDTSSRITETAQLEANKKLNEVEEKSKQIIEEAEHQAQLIVGVAEKKASNINESIKEEFAHLENDYQNLENHKIQLLAQLREIAGKASQIVEENSVTVKSEIFSSDAIKIQVENKTEAQAKTAEKSEEVNNEVFELADEKASESDNLEVGEISYSSVANTLNLEETAKEELIENIPFVEEGPAKTDLEIIEGIGPKLKEALNNSRIHTFRDLATTPIYRIKDILVAASPLYAVHDPSTWVDQALLAEAKKWNELEDLKDKLKAGRPLQVETNAEKRDATDVSDNSTEEMLDKVNKVKAAIRKSMIKNESIETTENKAIIDFASEKKQGGSFFDNLK